MKKELIEFLLKHNITFEEFNFLQILLRIEISPEDVVFRECCQKYYTAHENTEYKYSWQNMCDRLVGKNFLETYPKHIIKEDNFFKINLLKVKVSTTFKEFFFTDDKEKYFEEFINIFGKSYYIGDQLVSTLNPLEGETFENIVDRYWEKVDNGNLNKIKAVHTNTANYVKFIGNNMNINKYLLGYRGFMLTLEEKLNEINRNR